jgi:NADPH:quinone reductase-like Zn-dependent oxidoreductase
MKAAVFWKHGGPEVVEIADVPHPQVGPGQVFMAVRATALNHLDLWARRGLPGLEFEFPHIGGSDIAGIVEEVGDGVEGLAPGTRALVNPSLWCGSCDWCLIGEHVRGGFAEFAVVPATNVLPIPDDLSFEEAAAVPLVYQTAWRGLVSRGKLEAGESVLVTGASGGVSTAAIQIAKHIGATVFAVTAGPEKAARVRELGADHVFDRLESDFAKEVWKATDKRGVDMAFDSVARPFGPTCSAHSPAAADSSPTALPPGRPARSRFASPSGNSCRSSGPPCRARPSSKK